MTVPTNVYPAKEGRFEYIRNPTTAAATVVDSFQEAVVCRSHSDSRICGCTVGPCSGRANRLQPGDYTSDANVLRDIRAEFDRLTARHLRMRKAANVGSTNGNN